MKTIHLSILLQVYQQPNISPTKLARDIHLRYSQTRKEIDEMERNGLVKLILRMEYGKVARWVKITDEGILALSGVTEI